jgi:hypothetical protein
MKQNIAHADVVCSATAVDDGNLGSAVPTALLKFPAFAGAQAANEFDFEVDSRDSKLVATVSLRPSIGGTAEAPVIELNGTGIYQFGGDGGSSLENPIAVTLPLSDPGTEMVMDQAHLDAQGSPAFSLSCHLVVRTR